MREVECYWCGSCFAAQRSTARFCSNACRVAAHRRREHLHDEEERMARGGRWCEHCLEVVIEWWERPDKKFCSNACRQAAYRFMMPIDWTGFDVDKLAAYADELRTRHSDTSA